MKEKKIMPGRVGGEGNTKEGKKPDEEGEKKGLHDRTVVTQTLLGAWLDVCRRWWSIEK